MSDVNCYYVVKMLGKYCTGGSDSADTRDPGLSRKRSRAYKFVSSIDAHVFMDAWSRVSEYYACTMRPVKVRRG